MVAPARAEEQGWGSHASCSSAQGKLAVRMVEEKTGTLIRSALCNTTAACLSPKASLVGGPHNNQQYGSQARRHPRTIADRANTAEQDDQYIPSVAEPAHRGQHEVSTTACVPCSQHPGKYSKACTPARRHGTQAGKENMATAPPQPALPTAAACPAFPDAASCLRWLAHANANCCPPT